MFDQLKEKIKKGLGSTSPRGEASERRASMVKATNLQDFGEQYNRWVDQNSTMTKDDFTILENLGKGTFADVFLARRRDNQELVALKVMDKLNILEHNWVKRIHTECAVLLRVQHPYIVRMDETFQSEHKLFVVMQYFDGGDLESLLHRFENRRLPEHLAKFYAAEIYSALQYMHNQNIVYRDLKPLNIMLNREGHAHLVDMGLCKILDYDTSSTAEPGGLKRCGSFVGTPAYVAPEILRGKKYTFPVDWWSFGVLLHRMLIGAHPFCGETFPEVMARILVGLNMDAYTWLSEEAKNIVLALLEKHESRRLCGPGIKFHPFFYDINWTLLEQKMLPPPAIARTMVTDYIKPNSPPISPALMTNDNGGHHISPPAKSKVQSVQRSKSPSLSPDQQQKFNGFSCRSPSMKFVPPPVSMVQPLPEVIPTLNDPGLYNFSLSPSTENTTSYAAQPQMYHPQPAPTHYQQQAIIYSI